MLKWATSGPIQFLHTGDPVPLNKCEGLLQTVLTWGIWSQTLPNSFKVFCCQQELWKCIRECCYVVLPSFILLEILLSFASLTTNLPFRYFFALYQFYLLCALMLLLWLLLFASHLRGRNTQHKWYIEAFHRNIICLPVLILQFQII